MAGNVKLGVYVFRVVLDALYHFARWDLLFAYSVDSHKEGKPAKDKVRSESRHSPWAPLGTGSWWAADRKTSSP